jgi:hypothetical protein
VINLLKRFLKLNLANRNLPYIITTNVIVWNGGPGSVLAWTTWGQTDVFPFGDTTTTFGDLP